MKLSLIIPCYNEEDNIESFYKEVEKTFINKKNKIRINIY